MELRNKLIDGQDIMKILIGNEILDGELCGEIELDIALQAEFVDYISSFMEERGPSIIVDLASVAYIDSSGLWALFEVHKIAEEKKTRLVFIRPTEDVFRVLRVTKMLKKLSVFEIEREAVRFLKSE